MALFKNDDVTADNHVISLPELSSDTNEKTKFMPFRVKTPFPTFSGVVWTWRKKKESATRANNHSRLLKLSKVTTDPFPGALEKPVSWVFLPV